MPKWDSLKRADKKPKSKMNAMLGPGSNFEGTLHFEGTVRIDGNFKGKISSDDTLMIGKEAHVEASVEAGVVIVHGRVIGDVKARELLQALPGGKIFGNVLAKALKFEPGCEVEGNIMMIKG